MPCLPPAPSPLLHPPPCRLPQAGRSPPMFSGRTRAQVDSIAGDLRAKEAEAAAWAQFVADIQAAQAAPRPQKPGEAAWRQGPHGERLAALAALALGDLPPTGPERSLASRTLVDLGKTPATQVGPGCRTGQSRKPAGRPCSLGGAGRGGTGGRRGRRGGWGGPFPPDLASALDCTRRLLLPPSNASPRLPHRRLPRRTPRSCCSPLAGGRRTFSSTCWPRA